MCVLELCNCNTTCTVLCLWSWEFHERHDCQVLPQKSLTSWEISWCSHRLLATLLPPVRFFSETSEIVSSVTLWGNIFFVRRSIDLFFFALRDQNMSFALGNCYHEAYFTVLFAFMVASGFLGDSIHLHWVCCFPNWIVCACNLLCVSDLFWEISQTLQMRLMAWSCTEWSGKLLVWSNGNPQFFCGLVAKKPRSFRNVCGATSEVRLCRFLWNRVMVLPMVPQLRTSMRGCSSATTGVFAISLLSTITAMVRRSCTVDVIFAAFK